MAEAPSLIGLPTELHSAILSHLNFYDLYAVRLTCRHFSNMTLPLFAGGFSKGMITDYHDMKDVIEDFKEDGDITREQFEAWFADLSRSWLFRISDTEYWCGDWTCHRGCYTHSYMEYFEAGDTESENEEECEWEIGKCAIRAASGHMCDGVKGLEEDKLFREDQISKVIVPEKALGSGDLEGEIGRAHV